MGTKITALNELTAVADDDELVIVDTSTGETKRISRTNLVSTSLVVTSMRGLFQRCKFAKNTDSSFYLTAGTYHHVGTTEQFVYWNTTLSKTISGITGTQTYYVYLDDSAIVAAGTAELTASEIAVTTSAPVYSDTKHGYYSGNDRCIFMIPVTAGAIEKVVHDGGRFVRYDEPTAIYAGYPSINFITQATFSVPAVCTEAQATFIGSPLGTVNNYICKWRPTTSTGDGFVVAYGNSISGTEILTAGPGVKVTLDGSYEIDITVSLADTNAAMTVYQDGFYLPHFM